MQHSTDLKRQVALASVRAERLFSFEECKNDLEARIKAAGGLLQLKVINFGLDLDTAWQLWHDLLGNQQIDSIDLKFLIITENAKLLNPFAPSAVTNWCLKSPNSITQINDCIRYWRDRFQESKRYLNIEGRQYAEPLPNLHGFAVPQPFRIHYLSFCRWQEDGSFDWGGNRYRIIEDFDADPSDRDLAKMFDDKFKRYWGSCPNDTLGLKIVVNETFGPSKESA